MRFRTTIVQSGKNTTGIQVPGEVMEALGAGKRPAVTVTVNGYRYRSTVASMGGVAMVSLSAEHRAGAGVAGGDEVEVDLELDTAPREVEVPADLAAALDAEPPPGAPSTGCSTATGPGTSSRSPGPRPTRPAGAGSPGRSTCSSRGAPADDGRAAQPLGQPSLTVAYQTRSAASIRVSLTREKRR